MVVVVRTESPIPVVAGGSNHVCVCRWIVLQTMSGSLWGSFHVVTFNLLIFLLFMAHARAVFTDPGIVPLPSHRIDFSDSHSEGGSIAPKEDWTICTK